MGRRARCPTLGLTTVAQTRPSWSGHGSVGAVLVATRAPGREAAGTSWSGPRPAWSASAAAASTTTVAASSAPVAPPSGRPSTTTPATVSAVSTAAPPVATATASAAGVAATSSRRAPDRLSRGAAYNQARYAGLVAPATPVATSSSTSGGRAAKHACPSAIRAGLGPTVAPAGTAATGPYDPARVGPTTRAASPSAGAGAA